MKRIKQRLLSLAMTGALLLGFTLPEAFAASARSSNESSASEAQAAASEKSGKKQSKKKNSDTQAEEKSSETEDKAGQKAESEKDKASSKSQKAEYKPGEKLKDIHPFILCIRLLFPFESHADKRKYKNGGNNGKSAGKLDHGSEITGALTKGISRRNNA